MTNTQVELMILGLASDNMDGMRTRDQGAAIIDAMHELMGQQVADLTEQHQREMIEAKADKQAAQDEINDLHRRYARLDAEYRQYRAAEAIRCLLLNNKLEGFAAIDLPAAIPSGYESVVWEKGSIPRPLFEAIVEKILADKKIQAIKLLRDYSQLGLREAKFTIDRLAEIITEAKDDAQES